MPGWIIVSDADRTNLKTASHVLRKNGMRVSTVTSGHALLDCMNENGTPDLILLDMKMSDMDGFETLKKLRELEGGKSEIPVIFLTAEEDEESSSTSSDTGEEPLTLGAAIGRVWGSGARGSERRMG